MKIRNKDERIIKCVNFKEIAEGECFYDEYYDVIMMKVGSICAVNLDSGYMTQYAEQAYVALVDAEIVWEFKKE
jgi:hypothetical protein